MENVENGSTTRRKEKKGDKCWADVTSGVTLECITNRNKGRTGLTDAEVKKESNLMAGPVSGNENHRL